jgi:hypothetical protein
MTPRELFDTGSAALWFLLALAGVVLRIRRLIRLRQIVLIQPVAPRDAEYLASVKRSTVLRLGVKVLLLVGAVIALFHVDALWYVWRVGILVALAFMIAETVSVDNVRDRLGRAAEAG